MAHFNYLTSVIAYSDYNYAKCAVAKPNSDGSGGNVFAAVCGGGSEQSTANYPRTSTYATIINYERVGHTGFSGTGLWNTP